MKKWLSYLPLFPILYSIAMLKKTPTISDSLIVIAFCSLYAFIYYVNLKYQSNTVNTELTKLEEEVKIERLKQSIEQIKELSLRDKAARDTRNSSFGYQEGKPIRF